MQQQITFILKLRGVSALLVLLYHHCHFFWLNQDFCGRLAQQAPIVVTPWVAKFLESLPINLGNLGVAIFFLISGFLMPLAAQNKTRLEFLFRRLWRIWPTYAIALLLTMILVYVTSRPNQNFFPVPWKIDHILASLFLVRDIGGYPFIDGIVWTLEVELKFYLLCALARTWLVEKPIKFVWLIAALAALSFVLIEYRNWFEIKFMQRIIQIFFKTMKFVCFIGLGCLLSYIYQKKIILRKVLVYSLLLISLYFGYFIYAKNYVGQWKEIVSYVLAYLLFIVCYIFREKFLNRGIMAYMGTRSYSLYLVHGVPGFIMMYWLISLGLQESTVIVVATVCLLLGANMFYWTVENNLTKKP